MRRSLALFVLVVSAVILPSLSLAQTGTTELKLGSPIERVLARGESHTYGITMDAGQMLQLVVDQRGIDVIVRAFSPEGKSLGEFDTPNGAEGPENVSLISQTAGIYRIEVAPLGQSADPPPGRYEIRIVELRAATEQELQSRNKQDALKVTGIALLTQVAEMLPQLHLPEARVRGQVKAAQLLWDSNEKLATRLLDEAMEGVKEYQSKVDTDDQDYFQTYQSMMQLRQEVIQALGPHDPERALSFLRATRVANPDSGQNNNQEAQELALELSLASLITSHDPKRTFEIAENTLKRGYSYSLTDTLTRLRSTDSELAVKLAQEIAAKLQGEKLLNNPEAANMAVYLLRIARSPGGRIQASGATSPLKADAPLLSEQEYRDLFAKTLADGLSYNQPFTNIYTPERNAAQNIINSLKSMQTELNGYAPGSIASLEQKSTELNTTDPQTRLWQKYQDGINNGTVETAMEMVSKAPRELRDQLYQQVANKASNAGEFARASQILTDKIANPLQRRQALNNLEMQAIQRAANAGKMEEAMQMAANLHSGRDRTAILVQIVGQIGPGLKRATTLRLLEQARSLIATSGQAEDQEQMGALLEIARAFARYDPNRGFGILEPLLDQLNQMSAAAVFLNGFGQQYYRDGELMMQNGNSIADIANRLALSLAALATVNFDRAKAGADRLSRQEVRLGAYLAIAQETIMPEQRQMGRVFTR